MKEMSSMKKFIRITALVLCVVTLFALFSMTVFAESVDAGAAAEENKLPTIVVSAIIAGISAIIIGMSCAIVSAINKRK
jgi:preprotein translocase subunit SecE